MRNYAAPVRERAKHVVLSGLDRALAVRGLEGADAALARAEVIDGGRAAVRAARGRRRLVAALEVVVTRPGRAELRARPVVHAGPGEVTVELEASAVSPGTERAQWLRLPNAQPMLPFVPGYAGAGRVLAVGEDVAGLAPGDRVAVLPRAATRRRSRCPPAGPSPVPGGVAAPEAALAYLAVIAGYGVRRAGPLAGRHVCVLGAGPIGALARRLAALQAPAAVTVVARSRRREAAARADRFVALAEGADLADVGAAVVIEATGDPAAIAPAVAAARAGGTVVLLGSPRGITPDAALGDAAAPRHPARRRPHQRARHRGAATRRRPVRGARTRVPRRRSPPGGSTRPTSRARRSTRARSSTSTAASRAARSTPRTWTGRRCRPRSGSGAASLPPAAAGGPARAPARAAPARARRCASP